MPISHEVIIKALADQMILVVSEKGGQIIPLTPGVPGFALQTSNLKDGPPVALMYVFGEPFVKVLAELAQQLKQAIETAEAADRLKRKAKQN